MNKILVNQQEGTWIDLDAAERFEARTENGVLRGEALLITPGKNIIKVQKREADHKGTYTRLTNAEARSFFRTNKFTQDQTPAFLRDYITSLQIK